MSDINPGMSDEIRRIVFEQLNTFNAEKATQEGSYLIFLPSEKCRYYSLWFHLPSAVYHPYIYLSDLDLNIISSVNRAIMLLHNSLHPLYITSSSENLEDNGDDILSFGKYRGYHLYDIYTIDPRYVLWLANKYEPHVKSEFRFKELAMTYSKVFLDLQTHKRNKALASQFVGQIGEKLSNLTLTLSRIRLSDDPYKSRVIRGTVQYYVDQLLTAVDNAGNYFLLIAKAKYRSLMSCTLPSDTHAYQVGEIVRIRSAKVLKHIESHGIKYTKLGYINFI